MADYISDIQANDTTGNLVEINNVPITPPFFQGNGQDPVVTALLSTPGTVAGKIYGNWSFLVNDGTGGALVFASSASLVAAGYTPTVGNGLDLKGTYSPYHSLPEVGTVTQATVTSTGHSVPGPVTGMNINGILTDCAANGQTVTAGTISTTVLPNDIGARLVTLDNVWLSSAGTSSGYVVSGSTCGTGNLQAFLNDGSSTNTMSFYYWPTSYSVSLANLYGQPLDISGASHYNMTGFITDFPGLPGGLVEFSPISITPATPVPEPGTLALTGSLAAIAAIAYVRRRRAK